MSIQFITGKPGAGKSLWATMQICFELQHTQRHVCTNLPLKLDALAEWLIEATGSSEAMNRLRILTDEEVLNFWEHYAVATDVQGTVKIKQGDRTMEFPDFGPRCDPANGHKGTLYVIDELHIYFGARQWQHTGTDAMFYLSQHRHLGDDVLLISQHPDQVDKALRRLCQDFTFLTNMGKTKLLGFTFPGFGRRTTFANQGDRQPIESGTYRMKIAEYGKLYDTNAGAGGIVGRTDLQEKGGGGRSPLLIPVFVVVILLACWFLPKMLFAGMGTMARQASSGLSSVTQSATNAMQKMSSELQPKNSPAVEFVGPVQRVPVPQNVDLKSSKETNKLTIVRRMIIGPQRTYWLSDGRKVVQGDMEVLVAQEDYIILTGGKVVWFDR